jgi:hypothetical protein
VSTSDDEYLNLSRERLEAAEALCRLITSTPTHMGWPAPDAPVAYSRWRALASRPRPPVPNTPAGLIVGRRLALAEELIECMELFLSADTEGDLNRDLQRLKPAVAAWLEIASG